jgi:putative oxidoreductase
MIDTKTAPYAALILRLTTGILFVLHGFYLKVLVIGMTGMAGYFQSLGLPGFFAWVVMAYETVGGLMLILGVLTRPAAAFLGVHMLFVAWIGHGSHGWFFAAKGGGYEYPVMWAMALFAIALIGDGALALRPWSARREA